MRLQLPTPYWITPLIYYLWMKRTAPGVNFTNVLHAAFTLVDPEIVKKIDNLTVFFTLLRSVSVKAVRRTLMKLSPGYATAYPKITGNPDELVS